MIATVIRAVVVAAAVVVAVKILLELNENVERKRRNENDVVKKNERGNVNAKKSAPKRKAVASVKGKRAS
jgi:large-conductance mechanosensitive channel